MKVITLRPRHFELTRLARVCDNTYRHTGDVNMSATPSTNLPISATPEQPERTQAEQDALFASVVWFRTKLDAESYEKYNGRHVAILGEQIIDADCDEEELIRRVNALGDAIPQRRVLIQYLMTPEEVCRV